MMSLTKQARLSLKERKWEQCVRKCPGYLGCPRSEGKLPTPPTHTLWDTVPQTMSECFSFRGPLQDDLLKLCSQSLAWGPGLPVSLISQARTAGSSRKGAHPLQQWGS